MYFKFCYYSTIKVWFIIFLLHWEVIVIAYDCIICIKVYTVERCLTLSWGLANNTVVTHFIVPQHRSFLNYCMYILYNLPKPAIEKETITNNCYIRYKMQFLTSRVIHEAVLNLEEELFKVPNGCHHKSLSLKWNLCSMGLRFTVSLRTVNQCKSHSIKNLVLFIYF